MVEAADDICPMSLQSKKNTGVDVKIYTYASTPLTNRDATNFNAQYPTLTVKKRKIQG